MASSLNADNGVVSGSAGLKSSADSTGVLALQTNGTTAVTIDTAQNVGIGTTSNAAGNRLFSVGGGIQLSGGTSAQAGLRVQVASGVATITGINNDNNTYNPIAFYTSGSEAVRIDSSGNLLVGATSTFSTVGVTTTNTFSTSAGVSWAGAFQNTSATPVGVLVRYNTDVNGTGNSFMYCQGNATLRAEIRSNGGLANFSANNVNLSDERTKTDIQDAGGYLSKICAIPVRTFKYKDQTDDLLNLGVIAQEVEVVAPELVDVSGFGETPEDGVPLKAIYQTDLQYALMKCIQEQQAIITTLTQRIEALEGAK